MQVQFIPNHSNKLLSASVDGLICVFDTDGDINDDDKLETVSLAFCSTFLICDCIEILQQILLLFFKQA